MTAIARVGLVGVAAVFGLAAFLLARAREGACRLVDRWGRSIEEGPCTSRSL